MNTPLDQTRQTNPHTGTDYCEQTFEVGGRQVTNAYKCDQKHFSALDVWNIQNRRKEISIRSVSQSRIDLVLRVESN